MIRYLVDKRLIAKFVNDWSMAAFDLSFLGYAGKLFDALEKAGTDIMTTSSLVTQTVIAHRLASLLPS